MPRGKKKLVLEPEEVKPVVIVLPPFKYADGPKLREKRVGLGLRIHEAGYRVSYPIAFAIESGTNPPRPWMEQALFLRLIEWVAKNGKPPRAPLGWGYRDVLRAVEALENDELGLLA